MTIHKKKRILAKRIPKARALLECCTLCPRDCRVNRQKGEVGYCGGRDQAIVYGYMPHFGEEPPLSGTGGSGTIFFSGCSLRCCFCQNYDISILGEEDLVDTDQIAAAMGQLKDRGCHNINLVTPTHVVPFILEAVDKALDMGVDLPLIYNTSGYETPSTLALLDGIVDIYLPDFKFWDPDLSKAACNAPEYPDIARRAVEIMQAQVGDLKLDERGIAVSGMLVRHLVMPGTLKDVNAILTFLKDSVSPGVRVNLMSQYRPVWKAEQVPSFSKALASQEFYAAIKAAAALGIDLVR